MEGEWHILLETIMLDQSLERRCEALLKPNGRPTAYK